MHLRESIFHIFSYSWKERFQVEKVGGDIKLDVRIYTTELASKSLNDNKVKIINCI